MLSNYIGVVQAAYRLIEILVAISNPFQYFHTEKYEIFEVARKYVFCEREFSNTAPVLDFLQHKLQ